MDLTPFEQKFSDEFESSDFFNIPIDLTVVYGISTEEELLENASMCLLGRDRFSIQLIANDIIIGSVKKFFSKKDLVTISIQKEKLNQELVSAINHTLNEIGLNLFHFKILFQKDQSDFLKELEEKFKQKKLANFEVVAPDEIKKELNLLNQKIEANAQERMKLIEQKLNLLVKTK